MIEINEIAFGSSFEKIINFMYSAGIEFAKCYNGTWIELIEIKDTELVALVNEKRTVIRRENR